MALFAKGFRTHYSEYRERHIQTIMKVSSKSLDYLPIFFFKFNGG